MHESFQFLFLNSNPKSACYVFQSAKTATTLHHTPSRMPIPQSEPILNRVEAMSAEYEYQYYDEGILNVVYLHWHILDKSIIFFDHVTFCLSNLQPGSQGTNCNEKLRDQRRDFLHHVELFLKYQTLVIAFHFIKHKIYPAVSLIYLIIHRYTYIR